MQSAFFRICFFLSTTLLFSSLVSSKIVQTDCGPVEGNPAHKGVLSYYGIPYGYSERFFPSKTRKEANSCWEGLQFFRERMFENQLPKKNKGTYKATQFGQMCAQMAFGAGPVVGGEDCLFLNVWTPEEDPPAGEYFPVMVYIHGGSLIFGSGNFTNELPHKLARKGVVAVSLNYRLSTLGFLSLSALTEQGGWGTSGNYGILDQITALNWVKNNIQAFNGNPNLVTVFGQSSGGTSIFALLESPYASGLFSSAISMSGSALMYQTIESSNERNLQEIGIPLCGNVSSSEMWSCLQNLPFETLTQAQPASWNPPYWFGLPTKGETSGSAALIVVDGIVVVGDIAKSYDKGFANNVNVIFGNVAQESDLIPEDRVINYTLSQYKSLLESKFNTFDFGNGNFTDKVLEVYPIENYSNYQYHYNAISSDIRMICPNIYLASRARHGFDPSVNIYSYVVTQAPGRPFCLFPELDWCPTQAFHLWDLSILDADGLESSGYNLTTSDRQLEIAIQEIFLQFASEGSLNFPQVTQVNSKTNPSRSDSQTFPPLYSVIEIGSFPFNHTNFKRKECSFWFSYGFYEYTVQN